MLECNFKLKLLYERLKELKIEEIILNQLFLQAIVHHVRISFT